MTREELERRAHTGDEPAQLALADALDAEGRHTDAIEVLARAATAGSAAAKGRVGARLLIGDRAPALPVQGADLIAEAAREGAADAAALLAGLAAAGAYRRQSWDEAFDWLQRAAELGAEGARRQLALLCGDPAAAAEAAQAASGNSAARSDVWRRARAAVDLATLLKPPPAETVCADPLIRRFEGFASPAVCDWLRERAVGGMRRAEIYAGAGRPTKGAMNEARTNSIRVFNLAEIDLVQLTLQGRMAAATGVPFSHLEAMSVLHYKPGEAYTDHFDFVDPSTPGYAEQLARYGERIITFLVYLNDDYEGGDTAFPRLGINHHGARGEGLFFTNALHSGAPDERALHAGRPPARGEKWVATQFIRSRPFVPGST